MDPLRLVLALCACLWPTGARGSEWDCCEGDLLLLLDSSGSIHSYEFSQLLRFLSELLEPFLLGRGRVRTALVQVGTEPSLEFGLDSHHTQSSLQEALWSTRQLHGDTNTEQALRLVQRLLQNGAPPEAPPRVLLWLTDGVEPGAVDGPMAALRRMGVSVLAVSTGQGNYQLLRRVVTPPIQTHLYFVDFDDISIITEDLREAIIELIRAERLQVRELGSTCAVLHWRPFLSADLGAFSLHYELDPSAGFGSGSKLTLPGTSSWARLSGLRPDRTYTAWLVPENSAPYRRPLSVSFRTLPARFGPETVAVSELVPDGLRVSWSPVQPEQVQQYRVEFGEIPIGPLQTVALPSNQSSALLTKLRPHAEYLITVTALHSSGQQRAMSVRACTPEDTPPV
ncbi:von Willebrand factor A domain-containing protein 1-like [Pseudorasbora parva]|uniref:von Willebrand factor A domain-containing protein 1-like n=1 Tax=Pseudorasbora parva TaxID=51549 RepID=UPI00351F4E97